MSSSPAANLSIWSGDGVAVIRISGRANFQNGADFKATVLELWQRGIGRFILDLTKCQLMDSTFLGVMAGLGLRFSRETNAAGNAHIELLNPSARVADLFDNLGILHLFTVVTSPDTPVADPASLSPVPTPVHPPADRKATTRLCLEAHKLLMELNAENVSKFKDVTRFLEEDLRRMEQP